MEKKRSEAGSGRSISNHFSFNRKGQVTIFIILGIVILLAVIVVIFVREEIVSFKPEELMPAEKGRVENLLTSCIQQLGEEALFKIGEQGGYVQVPVEIEANSEQVLRTSPLTTIPYWVYGPNVRYPSLSEIKLQIDKHIQDNLRACVQNWSTFKEEYTITEKSPLSADTQILDSKTIFNVKWDLEIRNQAGEVEMEIIDHTAESDIKLKKLHDTAALIIDREMLDLKIEDLTQDLLALDHPLVPLTGMDFSCSKKQWKVDTAKNKLQDMLRVNLAQLQIKGTEVTAFPEELSYYQNHYVWQLEENYDQKDVAVFFNYQNNFPFYFSVSPKSGNTMSSSSISGGKMLPILCIQTWKFNYDLMYPVVVDLVDLSTGYHFKMAFTVHVKRNIPDRSGELGALPQISTTTLNFDSSEYCSESTIPMTFKTYSLVENSHEGVYYRTPLEKVNVSLTCIQYKCPIGSTEYDFLGMGDVAAYSTNVPYCVGGIVRGEKESYKSGWTRVLTKPGSIADIDLIPLKEIPADKVQIVVHPFNGINVSPTAYPLSEKQMATLQIYFDQKDDETVTNPQLNKIMGGEAGVSIITTPLSSSHDHESQLVFTPSIDVKIQQQERLQLLAQADFNYTVELLIYEQNGDEGKVVAGYSGSWYVPWDQLQNSKQITIHAVSNPNTDEEGMLNFINDLSKYSALAPQPTLK